MSEYSYTVCLRNIAWLREQRGLNRVEMARLLHVSVATLRRIESGDETVAVSGSVLYRVAEEFHVSPADLFRRRLWESVGDAVSAAHPPTAAP